MEREEIGGKVYSDIQPTLALGGITKGVKNIELNGAYAAIANGGEYIEPKLYTKITDHDGNVILDASQDAEKRRVLKATTAWLLTSAMEDVVTKGTGTAVNFGTTPIAGKTGTTSDFPGNFRWLDFATRRSRTNTLPKMMCRRKPVMFTIREWYAQSTAFPRQMSVRSR